MRLTRVGFGRFLVNMVTYWIARRVSSPSCTINGICTVKLLIKAGITLPPFLIMKGEGEVWQLATGEAIVCWKCGKAGHIGDKCRQVVNILTENIASPAGLILRVLFLLLHPSTNVASKSSIV